MFRIRQTQSYELEFQYIGEKPSWPHKFDPVKQRFRVCTGGYSDQKLAIDVAEMYKKQYIKQGSAAGASFTVQFYIIPDDTYYLLIASKTGRERIEQADWSLSLARDYGENEYAFRLNNAPTEQFKDLLRGLYTAEDGEFIVP